MQALQQPVTFTPRESASGAAAFPYELRVFSHSDEPESVFRLRHATYLHEGALDEPGGGLFTDAADRCEQTVHLAAFHAQNCKCAVRMTIKGWTDPIRVLPCAQHYPAIQSAGLRKLSIAELSHIVVDPAVTSPAHRTVLYSAMLRAGLLAVQSARIAMLVAAAKPEWLQLYTRMLRFHQIGVPARYPPSKVDLTLVGGNMVGAGRREVERNAFFKTSPPEIASMREALLRCLGSSSHKQVLAHSLDGPGA